MTMQAALPLPKATEATEQGICVPEVRTMRLPWRFDVSMALDEARRLSPELWRTHFNQGRHDGGWQALALRHAPQAAMDVVPVSLSPQDYVDSPALQACPAIIAILQNMGLRFTSVRLMQLLPGSEILEHVDDGLSAANGVARLHIPLQTHDDVFFYLNGERIPMRSGECWYTDVSKPHRVRNRSGQTRIHLVADVLVDEKLTEAFQAGDAGDAVSDANNPWLAFERFRAAVFDNADLADELVECADLKTLCERSVQLGQSLGYAFDASDVEAAMKAGQRAWRQQWVL